MSQPDRNSKGQLSIVGIGPAGARWMCDPAKEALQEAQVVCGYRTYIDLIRDILTPQQEIVQTGMTRERDRCKAAIDHAVSGKKVALVCSGDPGIYALSGLVFEMLKKRGLDSSKLKVEVIPGIPALSACSALLGAPLVHDFSVISLSDLLTPWELIEKRIEAAALADFVLVFYNPRSKKRRDHLPRALEIVARHRKGSTPVGIVTSGMRPSQEVSVTTLEEIREKGPDAWNIGMQSLVIVGNSQTFIWDGKMITPRGYEV
ncbi:MAG: precorrin-3B C(17)-methyltransferase [Thermodesulfobacteria bacterium]|nr:precorrin-3B C(17)-methyltransferase [Thermodesulfobacteriota bacterium]